MLVWAVCMLFPGTVAGMFTPDAELSSYTAWAMRIYMAASGIFGIQIACQQSFVALGQAKVAIFLALLRKVILLIPLILLLPRLGIFENAAFAVFLAEPGRGHARRVHDRRDVLHAFRQTHRRSGKCLIFFKRSTPLDHCRKKLSRRRDICRYLSLL